MRGSPGGAVLPAWAHPGDQRPDLLLVDHLDSFTHNLFHLLAGLGYSVVVARHDALTVEDALSLSAAGVVFSPGPGNPATARDFGLSAALLSALPVYTPVLGVCLGHQGIARHHGAHIAPAPRPMHGKTSAVLHRAGGFFAGFPSPLTAMRYHSLCVDPASLPPELQPLAWAEDGVLMAAQHRHLPHAGLQFHPESVGTPLGPTLVDACLRGLGVRPSGSVTPPRAEGPRAHEALPDGPTQPGP